MQFEPEQLETLLVITEEGTFEAAARRLHVTPSAVSSRLASTLWSPANARAVTITSV